MQALTVHSWPPGLARWSWVLPVFVVALCGAFAARGACALIAARWLSDAPESARPRPPPPRVAVGTPRADGGQLVERNMFCSQCVPGSGDAAATAVAGPPAIDRASLIATGLGREAYATLVVAATAVQGAWGVGDAIPGLGRLDRIGATWVEIVDEAGRRGRLSLREGAVAAAGRDPGTAMPGPVPAAWADRVHRIDEATYEVDRSLVRELATGSLREAGVRLIPMFRGEGVTARLAGVTRNSVAAALGLRNGDVVTALNGAPIRSLQQVLDVYAGIDQLSEVELSGTRDGARLVRSLKLR